VQTISTLDRKTRAAVAAVWLGCLLTWAPALHAVPYTPSSDDEVLQRLPAPLDASARARQAQLARDPTQLPLALAAAEQAGRQTAAR
jgi:hypothetical protein